MNWLFAAVLCVALVELVLRLPFAGTVVRITDSGRRSLRVVRSPAISDHWKERALSAYARNTMIASLRLALLLAVLAAVAAVLVVAFDRILPGFQPFILGWVGVGFSCGFACVYAWVRGRRPRGDV